MTLERDNFIAEIDKIHVPEDAGEYQVGLEEILNRIPSGWGRWIRLDKGWYPLVVDLDQKLSKVDPDYKVKQVKEKLAGLRYYFSTNENSYPEMTTLVLDAERRSFTICESCGNEGQLCMRNGSHWYKTLCNVCAKEQNYISYQPDAEDDRFSDTMESDQLP
jgi:hypothetical protein